MTTTDSQDFKDAYAYNSTATEYYRSTENCIVFAATGHARFEHARVLNNKTRAILRFSKFLQCKASCAIQACGAQLFNSGFSVTTTDSQDFRHAYAYNSTTTEHYRCIQRTAHTDTILAHDALHCKDMENRSTGYGIEAVQFRVS